MSSMTHKLIETHICGTKMDERKKLSNFHQFSMKKNLLSFSEIIFSNYLIRIKGMTIPFSPLQAYDESTLKTNKTLFSFFPPISYWLKRPNILIMNCL